MRFLIDAQLPPALAVLLEEHGHTAEHITDIGPADSSERELWRYALEHQSVIVTKDEDFANISPRALMRRTSCGFGSETPGAPRCFPGSSHASIR